MVSISLAIGLAITGAKVVSDMRESDKLNEQAMKKSLRACNNIAEAEIEKNVVKEKMDKEILRLMNRKKGILRSSMKSFLSVYDKIMQIQFTESDGIRELDNFKPALLEETIQGVSLETKGIAAPRLTTNVIKGFLVGGLLGAVSSSIVDDAQYGLDNARQQLKQANLIADQTRIVELSYRGVTERVSRMTETLTRCNVLFVKAIEASNRIIGQNGKDKSKYSENDRKTLGCCINLAGGIKDILDAPIIDVKGELTQMSLEAIEKSVRVINEVQGVLSNM